MNSSNNHLKPSAANTREATDRVPRSPVEWLTVVMIVACYTLWALAIGPLWIHVPIIGFVLCVLCVALHSSLTHEAAHGHPTRTAWVNELLVALPIGVFWPYRRFKALHLRHHADDRLTDPFDDPESYYEALWRYRTLPAWLRLLLASNNTMVGRFLLGPALATAGFVGADMRLVATGDGHVRRAWLHHLAGLGALAVLWSAIAGMPVWVYLLAAYLGHSVIAIRTFAEHQWCEDPDGRTIIVERSPLALLFLNNNLHFVHHAMPQVPWYKLPAIFRSNRGEWVERNHGYVYPGYLALLRAFALTQKEPVVHPAWRRAPDPGAAFRPRQRVRNVGGMGTAPVPAEPPRE